MLMFLPTKYFWGFILLTFHNENIHHVTNSHLRGAKKEKGKKKFASKMDVGSKLSSRKTKNLGKSSYPFSPNKNLFFGIGLYTHTRAHKVPFCLTKEERLEKR